MAEMHPYLRSLRLGLAGLTMVLLVGGTTFAIRGEPGHPKKEAYKQQVEQMEEAWRTAQLGGDVVAMDKLLADDYVGISMTGQVMTKTQQLDRMRNRSLQLTKIVLDDVKVKLIGTTAIVTSLAEIDGTNDGASMHGTYRYTRVYTRTPTGTWQITNFEATRVGPPPGPPPDGRRPRRGEMKPD